MAKRPLVVERILPDENINILVVGAHPADAFDDVGGTLAHHAARGDHITALVLTHGARVHDVVVSEEIRKRERVPAPDELAPIIQERMKVKHREVLEACKILGFSDLRFLTYDDSVLTLKEELMQQIAKVIREVRPHIVITHYPLENAGIASHHAITGQLVLNALVSAANIWPDDPNPPWRVPEVYFKAIHTALMRGNVLTQATSGYADVYVDVSDVIELKVKALDKMKSQQYDGAYARKTCEQHEGAFGSIAGVAYAEAFIRYSSRVYDYLPVSHYARARANELEADGHRRQDVLACHRVPE